MEILSAIIVGSLTSKRSAIRASWGGAKELLTYRNRLSEGLSLSLVLITCVIWPSVFDLFALMFLRPMAGVLPTGLSITLTLPAR